MYKIYASNIMHKILKNVPYQKVQNIFIIHFQSEKKYIYFADW